MRNTEAVHSIPHTHTHSATLELSSLNSITLALALTAVAPAVEARRRLIDDYLLHFDAARPSEYLYWQEGRWPANVSLVHLYWRARTADTPTTRPRHAHDTPTTRQRRVPPGTPNTHQAHPTPTRHTHIPPGTRTTRMWTTCGPSLRVPPRCGCGSSLEACFPTSPLWGSTCAARSASSSRR